MSRIPKINKPKVKSVEIVGKSDIRNLYLVIEKIHFEPTPPTADNAIYCVCYRTKADVMAHIQKHTYSDSYIFEIEIPEIIEVNDE